MFTGRADILLPILSTFRTHFNSLERAYISLSPLKHLLSDEEKKKSAERETKGHKILPKI